MRVCVLDIESEKLIEDWNKPWEGGLSVCGLWVNWAGGSMGEMRLYQLDELECAIRDIEEADVLVSKNGIRYDVPALEGMLGISLGLGEFGRTLNVRSHVDLQRIVEEALGFRVSLDNMAHATLGRAKDGVGAMAPTLWKDGRFARLHTYNMRDLALTRDLFLFAQTYGYILVTVDGQVVRIPCHVPGGVPRWQPLPAESKRKPNYEPATDRQIAAIQRLYGYEWRPTPGFTKVQASELIKSLKEVGR